MTIDSLASGNVKPVGVKGNAYISQGKIRDSLEQISAEAQKAMDILYWSTVREHIHTMLYRMAEFYFEQRYKTHIFYQGVGKRVRQPKTTFEKFLELSKLTPEAFLEIVFPKTNDWDYELLKAAYEAAMSNFPIPSFYSTQGFREHLAGKIAAASNYANRKSGHKIGIWRDRQKPANDRRRSGRGFSFKPEIPYQAPHVSTAYIVEEAMNCRSGPLEDTAFGHWADYEQLYRLRYHRKNHPEQSMPKIDWQAEREWRNQRHENNTRHNAAYLTTRESQMLHERLAKMRRDFENNPRAATGRDRTMFKSSNYH